MKKEKQYRLILQEPGKNKVILAEGSEDFCETSRLEESLNHNTAFLVIEPMPENKEEESKSVIFGWTDIIFVAVVGIVSLLLGRKEDK